MTFPELNLSIPQLVAFLAMCLSAGSIGMAGTITKRQYAKPIRQTAKICLVLTVVLIMIHGKLLEAFPEIIPLPISYYITISVVCSSSLIWAAIRKTCEAHLAIPQIAAFLLSINIAAQAFAPTRGVMLVHILSFLMFTWIILKKTEKPA